MAGTKLTFEVLSIDAGAAHSTHLITPMEVDGVMLCPLYQGGRMTTAKVTNIYTYSAPDNTASITVAGSPWTGIERPGLDESVGDNGEFTFGVPCGGVLNCKWVFTDDAAVAEGPDFWATATGSVYVNGDGPTYFGPTYSDPPGTEGTFSIALSCRPCGNLITMYFFADPYPG